MNTIKVFFSVFLILFISTSVFAFSTKDNCTQLPSDSSQVKENQASVVSAVSLFSFISLTEETKDSVNTENSRIVQFIDLIQTYL